MFCPAGPQHLSYLNGFHLSSLSPFGTAYLYVYKSFCSRNFSSFTFVHFLFQILIFCPAGPQHLSYLNECCLTSLLPFGAAYWYTYKSFYSHIFSSLTLIFIPQISAL